MNEKQKRNLKPHIDKDKLKVNPFSEQLKIVIKKMPTGTYSVDKDGDLIPKEIDLEQSRFTKVYHAAWARDLVMTLCSPAMALYLWIQYNLVSGQDWIWINKQYYMAKTETTSLNTYRKGVEELITCGFITPTIYKDTYWINPSLFFCGSRLLKYPSKVVEYTGKGKEQEDSSLTE